MSPQKRPNSLECFQKPLRRTLHTLTGAPARLAGDLEWRAALVVVAGLLQEHDGTLRRPYNDTLRQGQTEISAAHRPGQRPETASCCNLYCFPSAPV